MAKGLLDGKTAIVTGAGRGLGREISLLMAKEGANIIVNDFGGGADGSDPEGGGKNVGPAEEVVAEIEAAGGKAAANTSSVTSWTDAHAMVEQAMDTFGGIDIVVNNAGILRDVIFHKMTEEDFDIVVGVHLKGCFNVARAAAPQFRKQESGRMMHMTSTSGLVGNFGQVNYGAAKMGIVGLSRNIALDMARYNVTSNAISPFAWSRLIGTIPTETKEEKERVERIKQMTPAKVAPLATALASDGAQHITGQIFGSRGGEIFLFNQTRPIRGMARPEGWTPQTVLEHALPAMAPDLVALERSGDVFSWDPV